MSLPDLSDEAKVLHVGRMTLLRKARRETVAKLRDRMVPMFNAMDDGRVDWAIQPVLELLEQINAINQAIEELN
ncbi:uncharacterized protein YutE (UPF0331/DUF86 family) [Variovorax boronicumulans]|uniref:hypothetical protein n=1 Tax=Variovorax boronicumulans TaxID=436515 RepID=UPI003391E800